MKRTQVVAEQRQILDWMISKLDSINWPDDLDATYVESAAKALSRAKNELGVLGYELLILELKETPHG